MSSDLGWHIAIGNHFLKTGEIIQRDIFSWTMAGYGWGNSYFLYQIFLALIFEKFGFIFAVLFFAFLGSLGFLLLSSKLNFAKCLMVIFAAVFGGVGLGVRPHTFSFLFFSIFLFLIEKKLYSKPVFSFIFLIMFALWANIHRGFVFAILFFGLYIFFEFLKDKKLNKPAIFSFAAMFVGSLLTPFTFSVWSGGIIGDFLSFENQTFIAEWQSTALFFPVNIMIALSGMLFVYILYKNRSTNPPIFFVVSMLTFAFAFIFVNLVIFWAALFALIVSRYLNFRIPVFSSLKRGEMFLVYIFTIFSFVVLFLNSIVLVFENWKLEDSFVKSRYPVGAVAYMQKNTGNENIFNEYDWGGYLIWQVPQAKTFIDGRMASWKKSDGSSILRDYLRIYAGDCDLAKLYNVKTFLVKKNYSSPCLADFKEVYSDESAMIFVKI